MRLHARAERRELAELRIVQDVPAPFDDRSVARVDDEVIGIHRARDELLPQPPHRVDDRAAATAGDRLSGEEDARALGADHPLHHDREPKSLPVDAVCLAIRDRALIPERRPAPADRVEQRLLAARAEDRVLLSGEARLGQILGGRGRAGRDPWRAEGAVCLADRLRTAGGPPRPGPADTGPPRAGPRGP